ncbi:hypothetical protein Hanom_Chr00s000008g01616401 [Helianthus anomalus]
MGRVSRPKHFFFLVSRITAPSLYKPIHKKHPLTIIKYLVEPIDQAVSAAAVDFR